MREVTSSLRQRQKTLYKGAYVGFSCLTVSPVFHFEPADMAPLCRGFASLFALASFVTSIMAINTTISMLTPPSSQVLSQNLLGFSIEQDRWPDWTGVDSRNEFTHSALLNYALLTGKPPRIRVGANSEDHTVWSPTITVSLTITLSAPRIFLLLHVYLAAYAMSLEARS